MQKDTTYVLIETMVKIALREICNDPERTTRKLVDMALHFSNGRFQRRFFELAQTSLQKKDSPYYGVVIDIVQHTQPEILLQFGMNVGYNGCTLGAKTIRELEAEKGYNIPWTIFMQLPESFPRHTMDRYQSIITQGEKLGIHTWLLFASGHPHSALHFAAQNQDSAFALFCDPRDITLTFLDCAGELKNLMIVLKMDDNAEAACSLLRAAGLLYSVYSLYSEETAQDILGGSVLAQAEALHPAFTVLLPTVSCPEAVRTEIYEHVLQIREEQTFVSLPLDLYGDCLHIDSIISDDACIAGFDQYGYLNVIHGKQEPSEYNLLHSDLSDIFSKVFPKGQVQE